MNGKRLFAPSCFGHEIVKNEVDCRGEKKGNNPPISIKQSNISSADIQGWRFWAVEWEDIVLIDRSDAKQAHFPVSDRTNFCDGLDGRLIPWWFWNQPTNLFQTYPTSMWWVGLLIIKEVRAESSSTCFWRGCFVASIRCVLEVRRNSGQQHLVGQTQYYDISQNCFKRSVLVRVSSSYKIWCDVALCQKRSFFY